MIVCLSDVASSAGVSLGFQGDGIPGIGDAETPTLAQFDMNPGDGQTSDRGLQDASGTGLLEQYLMSSKDAITCPTSGKPSASAQLCEAHVCAMCAPSHGLAGLQASSVLLWPVPWAKLTFCVSQVQQQVQMTSAVSC